MRYLIRHGDGSTTYCQRPPDTALQEFEVVDVWRDECAGVLVGEECRTDYTVRYLPEPDLLPGFLAALLVVALLARVRW